MNKQAEMNYGTIDQVCQWLDQTECSEGELRAALLNAFRQIEGLNARVKRLETAQMVYGSVTSNA